MADDLLTEEEALAAEQDAAETTPAPSKDFHDLDQRRRQTLLTVFCAAATGLLVVSLAVALLRYFSIAPQLQGLWLTVVLVLAVAPCATGAGWWLARRGQPTAAGIILLSTLLITIFIVHVVSVESLAIEPYRIVAVFLFFAAYPIVIVLAGVMSNRQFLLGTGFVAMVFSLIGDLLLPDHFAVAISRGTVVIAMLVLEAITLGAMDLFLTGYLQTLQQLDETRIKYELALQIDSLKEQFITSVNHELRNPVMAMLGYLELLQLPRNRAAPERLDVIVKEANRAGQDLRALLNNILETRRMDQGIEDFTPQPVSVRDAIDAAVRLIDPREANLEGRALRVRVSPQTIIWGDPVHLQQILTNLISNAVKYSGPDNPVEVSAGAVVDVKQREGRWGRKETTTREMVEIVVRDYGLGIPPDQAPLLFQRFARLPRDLASKVVGNGLGLYLCRALAEVMGGTIRLESAGIPGKGTTFYVRLPVVPQVASPAQTGGADGQREVAAMAPSGMPTTT